MSKHLEYLIAILKESDRYKLCMATSCDCVSDCANCPLDSSESLSEVVKELEVLQHAKA